MTPPSKLSTRRSLQGYFNPKALLCTGIRPYCTIEKHGNFSPDYLRFLYAIKNSSYLIPRGQFWGGLLRRPLTSSTEVRAFAL
jgi:hypothetical protein